MTLSLLGRPVTHHWTSVDGRTWHSRCGLVAQAGELEENRTGWLCSRCGESFRSMGEAALAWQDLEVNEVPAGVVPLACVDQG